MFSGRFRWCCQIEDDRNIFNDAYNRKKASTSSDDFIQECLRSHNHYRAEHGSPALHLSVEVSAFSQNWADRLAQEDHFHHSNHPQYGENLFVTYMSDNSLPMATGKQVVESWYAENVYYPFGGHITREIISKAGHFTQVIWKSSRELGIGRSMSKTNRVYVVANYQPAGNILNRFKDNVLDKVHNSYHHQQYTRRILSRRLDMNHLKRRVW